jgi:hypothetical protein
LTARAARRYGSAMRALLVVLLVPLAGCLKAQYLPNPHGGWTLMTEAQAIDQAVIRFQRTAKDLCGAGPYQMGEVTIMDRGMQAGRAGGVSTDLTVKVDLTCD